MADKPTLAGYKKGYVRNPELEKCTVEELHTLREKIFDKWIWETGSEEDKKEIKAIDTEIQFRNRDARSFYCPYIPLMINSVVDE